MNKKIVVCGCTEFGYDVTNTGFLNPSAIRIEDNFSSANRINGIKVKIIFFIIYIFSFY